MNPTIMNDEVYSHFPFESDANATTLLVPLWQAISPQTSSSVLAELTLNHPNDSVRSTAAGNPSTPILACVKWLLEHNVDLASTSLAWALPVEIEGRVDTALVKNGCDLLAIEGLPLSWKLKLLVTLG